MRNQFIISIVLVFLIACKKDNIDQVNYLDKVKVYAPYKIGSELYYVVDSTFYDDFKDTIYTRTIYRRCLIDSLDNSIKGRILFHVRIEETTDTFLPWTHIRVDQWAITQQYFETQVHNIRFTHLIFPFNYESVWNVNQYTTLQEKLRYYTSLEEEYNLEGRKFNKVLHVENKPLLNAIVDKQYQEVFAENIGCVYKKITNIDTQFGKPRGFAVINKIYAYKI